MDFLFRNRSRRLGSKRYWHLDVNARTTWYSQSHSYCFYIHVQSGTFVEAELLSRGTTGVLVECKEEEMILNTTQHEFLKQDWKIVVR